MSVGRVSFVTGFAPRALEELSNNAWHPHVLLTAREPWDSLGEVVLEAWGYQASSPPIVQEWIDSESLPSEQETSPIAPAKCREDPILVQEPLNVHK